MNLSSSTKQPISDDNASNDKLDILTREYSQGDKFIPFITFSNKITIRRPKVIFNSHYCDENRVNALIEFCENNGISFDNHGKQTKVYNDGQ